MHKTRHYIIDILRDWLSQSPAIVAHSYIDVRLLRKHNRTAFQPFSSLIQSSFKLYVCECVSRTGFIGRTKLAATYDVTNDVTVDADQPEGAKNVGVPPTEGSPPNCFNFISLLVVAHC